MRKAKTKKERIDMRKNILELYENGYTIDEIAELLGITKTTVYAHIPLKEEREEKKKKIKDYIAFKELPLEKKMKRIFKGLEKMEKICEFDNTVQYRIEDKKGKEYFVLACNGDIEFVIEKQGCNFQERYDLSHMDKLKRLIVRLNNALQDGLTEKEVDILLSSKYSVDLQYIDKEAGRFIFRAWEKGEEKEEERKFISIVNSTRQDIYDITKKLVEVRRKVFRGR